MASRTHAVSKIPPFYGEKERLQSAFVYSHLDSRGGSTLIVAPDEERAHKAYLRVLGWDEEPKGDQHSLIHADFIAGPIPVIVIGSELPEPTPVAHDASVSNHVDLLDSFQACWLCTRRGRQVVALVLASTLTGSGGHLANCTPVPIIMVSDRDRDSRPDAPFIPVGLLGSGWESTLARDGYPDRLRTSPHPDTIARMPVPHLRPSLPDPRNPRARVGHT